MEDEPGQDPGQPAAGFTWGDLVGALVDEHGTLAQVAWKLIEHASGDDVASIERALRRLRGRGQLDGGVWGQRVLRVFGVPTSVEARVRWMGLYHTPFNDLAIALCLDLVRVWDRPPIATSRARVWLQLAYASIALRERRFPDATHHLTQARAALAGLPASYDAARLELALTDGYLAEKLRDEAATTAALAEADALLASASLDPIERACFVARTVDQHAYRLNHRGEHVAARALYDGLPAADVHPFASYRRDSGRAYGALRAGDRDLALQLAQRACDHAGDGGYIRLRVMGLLVIAKIVGKPASAPVLDRAREMAARLRDRELLTRVAAA